MFSRLLDSGIVYADGLSPVYLYRALAGFPVIVPVAVETSKTGPFETHSYTAGALTVNRIHSGGRELAC